MFNLVNDNDGLDGRTIDVYSKTQGTASQPASLQSGVRYERFVVVAMCLRAEAGMVDQR